MRFTIPPHLRLLFAVPVLGVLAACAAGDSTAPVAGGLSQPAASKGSGSDGGGTPVPTPVPGTISGVWKGMLITPSGSQPTTMLLKQKGTDVTGDAYFLVSGVEQRLRINRGLVLNGTSVTLLLLDGNGKESSVRYAGQLSADGRTMTGAVIDLRGPQYPLDLILQ
jgi:hypothetical protein